MKLQVVAESKSPSQPWYADGLNFTCTTCGNCCTGGPGFVFAEEREIELAAQYLNLPVADFRRKYCRRVGTKVSFKEVRQPNGNHDCIFLTEIPAESSNRELEPGEPIPMTRRVCGLYGVRPLQCRTWPFWSENVSSPAAWKRAAKGCPGMDRGGRHFDLERIETLRTATEWPDNPPTSGAAE